MSKRRIIVAMAGASSGLLLGFFLTVSSAKAGPDGHGCVPGKCMAVWNGWEWVYFCSSQQPEPVMCHQVGAGPCWEEPC